MLVGEAVNTLGKADRTEASLSDFNEAVWNYFNGDIGEAFKY